MELMRKVVVTGMGAICAAGIYPEQILNSLLDGIVNISEHKNWETANWPCRWAGIVGINPRDLINDRKLLKLIKRTDVLGIYVAEKALASAGIRAYRDTLSTEADDCYAERFGIYGGTSGALHSTQYDFLPLIKEANGSTLIIGEKLNDFINPMWLLGNLPNNVLCHVGIRNKL